MTISFNSLSESNTFKAEYCAIFPDEIKNAEEIFLTGSAVEVTPVGKIDNQTFKVGDITAKISSLYMKEVDPDYKDN